MRATRGVLACIKMSGGLAGGHIWGFGPGFGRVWILSRKPLGVGRFASD